MFFSMKISQDIRREHGGDLGGSGTEADIEAGMRAKSEEFAASGNRVYLPLAD
ncbi:Thiamin biosynthesis protein ThiC [Streptomyces mobaraensis NBRC 13819 = DSM 40847]|uniref:Thiamin biosynthesis protein ThiC n=1 Tax=Streptomyces mobaraensis (strain ATCC 29032 / DSM 40847 / JCM 4168 / NBRC 13819 / NCIMB 11159 / IPCR 16-22) TaxID=1223523 RepID=M3AYM4_STRM1|nr:Thiamin biosynthesis protein ThiC [Streptomyces mobaraensis NBRC 13819 = DSM 40847]